MSLTARFVFDTGQPLEIQEITPEQKSDMLKSIESKKPYIFEKDDKMVWADFSHLRYFYFVPYVPPTIETEETSA